MAWVLSSDIVYEPSAYEPLLATLCALATPGGGGGGEVGGAARPRLVMAHRSRNPDEHKFFSAAAERFALRVLQGPPRCDRSARPPTHRPSPRWPTPMVLRAPQPTTRRQCGFLNLSGWVVAADADGV